MLYSAYPLLSLNPFHIVVSNKYAVAFPAVVVVVAVYPASVYCFNNFDAILLATFDVPS